MSDLFLGLFLLTILAGALGLLNPRLVRVGPVQTRGDVGLIYGVLAIIFFVSFGYSLPPKEEAGTAAEAPQVAASEGAQTSTEMEPSTPEVDVPPTDRLLARVSRITDTSAELKPEGANYRLEATYKPKAIWSPSSYIDSLGVQLQDIGSAASASGVPVESITLRAFAPARDRYGNEDVSLAFVLVLAKADFGRINWQGVTPSQLLDLVSVKPTPFGRTGLIEYCSDKANFHAAPHFCSAAFND